MGHTSKHLHYQQGQEAGPFYTITFDATTACVHILSNKKSNILREILFSPVQQNVNQAND